MSDDWESKTVIGFKRQTAKVTKKDSDLNGKQLSTTLKISTDVAHMLQLYAIINAIMKLEEEADLI